MCVPAKSRAEDVSMAHKEQGRRGRRRSKGIVKCVHFNNLASLAFTLILFSDSSYFFIFVIPLLLCLYFDIRGSTPHLFCFPFNLSF